MRSSHGFSLEIERRDGLASFGARRIDTLLGGGIPHGENVVVEGGSFLGKETLARRFLLTGLERGEPAVIVLIDRPAEEARVAFAQLDSHYLEYERDDLVRFIDASGAGKGRDGPVAALRAGDDLKELGLEIDRAQLDFAARSPHQRLLLDSVSTLLTYTDVPRTFRFLQRLLGRSRSRGASSLLLMESGAQTPEASRAIEHLVSGAVFLRMGQESVEIRLMGLGLSRDLGWISCRSEDERIDLSGSVAGGRIR